MRPDDRCALRARFAFRCAYCGISEREMGSELTVDHFQPRTRGGSDEPENWVYCCPACNQFKGDYWQPESPNRILHPYLDDLNLHIREREDGTLEGLSATGVFHIQKLHLNRPGLVAHRREKRLIEAWVQGQADLARRLDRFEHRLADLDERLERLTRRFRSME